MNGARVNGGRDQRVDLRIFIQSGNHGMAEVVGSIPIGSTYAMTCDKGIRTLTLRELRQL